MIGSTRIFTIDPTLEDIDNGYRIWKNKYANSKLTFKCFISQSRTYIILNNKYVYYVYYRIYNKTYLVI